MKKALLDTDVIIDFLRKGLDSSIFQKIKERKIEAYISSITLFELYNGALLSKDPKQKLEDLSQMMNTINLMSFGGEQAYVASKIYAYLRKSGLSVEMKDIMIAACAVSKGLELYTRNKKHFERMPELEFLEISTRP